MTRNEKLVRARRQQRDEAAQQLATRHGELARLRRARARLAERSRAELSSASASGPQLSARRLELLDLARRAAVQAEEQSAEAVEQARQEALSSEVSLKQMEWLRDREAEKRRAEQKKREQRAADSAASRVARNSVGLLLVCTFVFAACQEEKPKATPSRDSQKTGADSTNSDFGAKAERSDGGPAGAGADAEALDGRPGADLGDRAADGAREAAAPGAPPAAARPHRDLAEQRLLGKLRERDKALRRREAVTLARTRELAQLERKVGALIDRLAKVQRGTGRAAAPGSTTSPSGTQTRSVAALAAVVLKMKPRAAGQLLGAMNAQEAARLLLVIPHDRAADLLGRLPEEAIGAVGDAMAAQQRLHLKPSTAPNASTRPRSARAKETDRVSDRRRASRRASQRARRARRRRARRRSRAASGRRGKGPGASSAKTPPTAIRKSVAKKSTGAAAKKSTGAVAKKSAGAATPKTSGTKTPPRPAKSKAGGQKVSPRK